ncbi:MAG TPA: RNA polymerase sigma factor [Bacteroidales bacterium]|nr:RNA polymerase sigma factor [Bacteroidales bacterium]
MTDSELIKSLSSQDGNAFRYLVENYEKMVFKACYHILNNYQDAEDVAQEVFVEAYLSISSFRGESKISTWLFRIAVNKSKNLLRKNKWQLLIQRIEKMLPGDKAERFDMEDVSAHESMLSIEKQEDQKILWKAIESLPENQRIAFTLNKYNDLSYQEIAEAMQTSLPAIESLIHRAKINLQKKLAGHFRGKG